MKRSRRIPPGNLPKGRGIDPARLPQRARREKFGTEQSSRVAQTPTPDCGRTEEDDRG